MVRPRKLQTEELLEVIHKYLTETPYLKKLAYSDLSGFANKLGYSNITYQDFSRNTKIQEFVYKYNEQKKLSDSYKINSKNLIKLDFNVDRVVDKNINDSRQLKAILKIYKDGYDKAFDSIIEVKNENKELKSENEELKNLLIEKDRYIKEIKKKSNANLADKDAEIKSLKARLKALSESEKIKREDRATQDMCELLKYVINEFKIPLKDKEDLVNLIKNFGYRDNSNDINKEKIINEEFNIVDIEEFNRNTIMSITEDDKKLRIPDFMK